MRYTVLRPTGDYADRQREATEAGALLYLEQHLNASTDPHVCHPMGIYRGDIKADTDPDARPLALAQEYAEHVFSSSGFPFRWPPESRALFSSSRGYGNLSRLGPDVVGILMEPGHVSNPAFAAWVKTPAGILGLARCIVHVVRGAAPHGGVIALSVGHIGKTSSPHDRGAPVHGGGWEGDLAQRIVDLATALLATEIPPAPRSG